MACFIGFVLCSVVAAYIPVLIVRECPHCRAHVVQEDTLTGNTIGAMIYTDGKREAKMVWWALSRNWLRRRCDGETVRARKMSFDRAGPRR
jgi:hypothetical protein